MEKHKGRLVNHYRKVLNVQETATEYDYDEQVPRFWFSSRFGIAAMGFLGFLTMNSQRVCMEVAMRCMINRTALALEAEASIAAHAETQTIIPNVTAPTITDTIRCEEQHFLLENVTIPSFYQPLEVVGRGGKTQLQVAKNPLEVVGRGGKTQLQVAKNDGEFTWNKTRQDVVRWTFYWAYILSQIPCGWLAERYGGKKILGLLMLTASGSTMLIPLGSRTHYFLLISLRVLGGVGAGVAYPAMHAMLGKWSPPLERSKLASIAYSGTLIGTVLTLELSGLLCKYGFKGGWPSIFYTLGGFGVLWSILWLLFASETPLEHWRISNEEQVYLIRSLARETSMRTRKKLRVPCLKMLTSFPYLVVVICHFTFEWMMHTFIYSVPEYMEKVLAISMKANSVASMLPFVGWCFVTLIAGFWADKLRSRGLLATAVTRKIMQLIGTIFPVAMLVGICFLGCSHWAASVSMLSLGTSLAAFQTSGFFVNHLDIAPAYAGILMGISNTVGLLAGYLAPYLVKVITSEQTQEQWQTVFFISAAVAMFGSLCFLVGGAGMPQKWSLPESGDADTKDSGSSSEQDSEEIPQIKASTLPHKTRPHDDVLRRTPSEYQSRPNPEKVRQEELRRTQTLGRKPRNPDKPLTNLAPPIQPDKSSTSTRGSLVSRTTSHTSTGSAACDEDFYSSLSESVV